LAENVYEGMFILDSNRYSREASATPGMIADLIEKCGGTMLANRLWEERRLAYPIDGHRKGAYWLTYFKLDPLKLAELNRQCQINDAILRTLFLKVDPRISETLVSHALAGSAGRRPQVETAPAMVGIEGAIDAIADL
jgi:small subunit ribosomal protein S6